MLRVALEAMAKQAVSELQHLLELRAHVGSERMHEVLPILVAARIRPALRQLDQATALASDLHDFDEDGYPSALESTVRRGLRLSLQASGLAGGLGVACFYMLVPLVLLIARLKLSEGGEAFADWAESGSDEWLQVALPGGCLLVLQLVGAHRLSQRMGFDMLQERSEGMSIKRSLKTNMSTQGVTAALFLGIIVANLRATPPNGLLRDRNELITQWYQVLGSSMPPPAHPTPPPPPPPPPQVFSCLSAAHVLISVVCARMLLIYTEVLDERATRVFMGDHLAIVGEPVAHFVFGLGDTAAALALWVIGQYGPACGVLALVALGISLSRISKIMSCLSTWVNPTVTPHQREERARWATRQRNKVAPAPSADEPPQGHKSVPLP